MFSRHRTARREEPEPEAVAEETGHGGHPLDADVETMLDEIDCCLADAAAELEHARLLERRRAKAEWDAIGICSMACSFSAGRCLHVVQQRIWKMRYAHLFDWCCGMPVFPEDLD